MIGEILGTFNIIEKASRFIGWFWKSRKLPPDTVSSRFIKLFESHDVHRNQIPGFFGYGLTLKDVQDEALLLDKLNTPMLDAACTLFGVRPEWLLGAESQIYPCQDFYKSPERVAPFLRALKESNPDGGLDGILIAPTEQQGEALLVLSEVITCIGEKPIYRYHLCNNWLFDYWKSRAYLTSCVAIAWKHGVHIRGGYLPLKQIKQIVDGEELLGTESGSLHRRGKLWYPEDMAIEPEVFLSGVNPERNKFGLISALELWLRLEESDYMDTGLSMYSKASIRNSFEHALEKFC